MSEAVGRSARLAGRERPAARLHRIDALVSPYLYVGPFFVVFCAFGLFPLGYTAYMSLTDRNLLEPDDALRRAPELHRAPPRLVLLERGREHARDLGALDGPPAPAGARRSRIC